jgi:hypothetical protein
MAVTTDILASYRGPGRVVARLLAAGQREDRALAILMAGCVLVFVAQLPRLAREAHLAGQELNPILGGSLLAWVIIAPLLFYILAALSHVIARVFGGRGGWYGARLALFWALLASTPVLLLHGLVSGLIGPGSGRDAVGLIWLAVFLWFWLSGLWQAERKPL